MPGASGRFQSAVKRLSGKRSAARRDAPAQGSRNVVARTLSTPGALLLRWGGRLLLRPAGCGSAWPVATGGRTVMPNAAAPRSLMLTLPLYANLGLTS